VAGTRRCSAADQSGQAPDATLLNIHDMPAPRPMNIVVIQIIIYPANGKVHRMAVSPPDWKGMLLFGIQSSRFPGSEVLFIVPTIVPLAVITFRRE
jgi:hypothetical protein